MSEISGITGPTKLTSKPKASLEATSKQETVQASSLENKMQDMEQAFALVHEVRHSLETLLKDL